MISSLRGIVLAVEAQRAVIEVAGVGYSVAVTPQQALALRAGDEAFLHTALIVREDELSLCGFATRAELEVFELLRGVTGVGPKSALGVLAALTPDEIAAAVSSDDDAPFRRVSGIGPKTAKLIVISLAGKLAAPSAASSRRVFQGTAGAQARIALEGLGFPERHAKDTVDEILSEHPVLEVGALVRLALGRLGPFAQVTR